jgi:NitT/TauT family transport system substrate-binding protein
MRLITNFAMMFGIIALVGCGTQPQKQVSNASTDTAATSPNGAMPVFSFAASEYPSWSTFMVAAKAGLINPKEGGAPGTFEKKWNVDIVLHVKDYDPCITMFGGGTVDGTCLTNIDALNPAFGRATTAIMPTSTSAGADKIITVGNINNLADLKGKKTYGLAKSVSHYNFYRLLKQSKLNPADYPFVQLDPAAAATAIQSGNGDVQSISVWNPFALQTLRTNTKSKSIADSGSIPEEIIDMVVVATDSLEKPGGDRFAACLCDVFYEINRKLEDPKTSDTITQAIGADFSNLPLTDMRICLRETRFYANPKVGTKLFVSPEFRSTMKVVQEACLAIELVEQGKMPTVGFNEPVTQLNFDTRFMNLVSKNR